MTTLQMTKTDTDSATVRAEPAAVPQSKSNEFPLQTVLPRSPLPRFDWRSMDSTIDTVKQYQKLIAKVDAQDRANAEATYISCIRDETKGAINCKAEARDRISRMEDILPELQKVDLEELRKSVAQPGQMEVSAKKGVRELLKSLAERTCERRRFRLEDGSAGRIGWYGRDRCIHSFARIVVVGDVLSEEERKIGTRMTNRKIGKDITWAERAWNGRRMEETFSSKKIVDVETRIETNKHSLINARCQTVSEALKSLPKPRRIQECLEIISDSAYDDLYYVAVGDLYDAEVHSESLGRKKTTVERTWKNVWYACEPAVVFAPLSVVESGWLDASDD